MELRSEIPTFLDLYRLANINIAPPPTNHNNQQQQQHPINHENTNAENHIPVTNRLTQTELLPKNQTAPTSIEFDITQRRSLYKEEQNILNRACEEEIEMCIIKNMQAQLKLKRKYEDVIDIEQHEVRQHVKIQRIAPNQSCFPGGDLACTGIALSFCVSFLLTPSISPFTYEESDAIKIIHTGVGFYLDLKPHQLSSYALTDVTDYYNNITTLFRKTYPNQFTILEDVDGYIYHEMNSVTNMFVCQPNITSLQTLVLKLLAYKTIPIGVVITSTINSIALLADHTKTNFYIIDSHKKDGTEVTYIHTSSTQIITDTLQKALLNHKTSLHATYRAVLLTYNNPQS